EAGGQFVLLGSGDSKLEHEFAQMEAQRPGRASVRLRFDAPYAHPLSPGADLVLIPSRYEPCGLTQMIAMRYGAVPVARRTGGLADTIPDFGDPGGTGVLFDGLDPVSIAHALERAARVYAQPGHWRELQRRGRRKDFSWTGSAWEYESLYRHALRWKGAAATSAD